MRARDHVSDIQANLVFDQMMPVGDGQNSVIPVACSAINVRSTIPAWTDADILHWIEAGST